MPFLARVPFDLETICFYVVFFFTPLALFPFYQHMVEEAKTLYLRRWLVRAFILSHAALMLFPTIFIGGMYVWSPTLGMKHSCGIFLSIIFVLGGIIIAFGGLLYRHTSRKMPPQQNDDDAHFNLCFLVNIVHYFTSLYMTSAATLFYVEITLPAVHYADSTSDEWLENIAIFGTWFMFFAFLLYHLLIWCMFQRFLEISKDQQSFQESKDKLSQDTGCLGQ